MSPNVFQSTNKRKQTKIGAWIRLFVVMPNRPQMQTAIMNAEAFLAIHRMNVSLP